MKLSINDTLYDDTKPNYTPRIAILTITKGLNYDTQHQWHSALQHRLTYDLVGSGLLEFSSLSNSYYY
jgi:hypothetical protein